MDKEMFMKSKLLSRLKALEARVNVSAPRVFLYRWVKPLSAAFVGERHVAILNRKPVNANLEWYVFEERPGPALAGSLDCCVALKRTQVRSQGINHEV
jgi:hypothetical protein